MKCLRLAKLVFQIEGRDGAQGRNLRDAMLVDHTLHAV